MTDQELLMMAAQAAGIEIPKPNAWFTYDERGGFEWWNMDGTRVEKRFNPLSDDGQALRLAVRLGHLDLQWCIASAWQASINEDDALAHVRREIVTQAAKFGKALPLNAVLGRPDCCIKTDHEK